MAANVPESKILKHFCDFKDQEDKVCGAGPYDIAHLGIHKRAAHGIIGKKSHRSRPKSAPRNPGQMARLIRKTQIETGLSIRKTAQLLDIPKSTAERYLAKSKKKDKSLEPITEQTNTSDIPLNSRSHHYHCPHPGCATHCSSRGALGAHRKVMHNFSGTSYLAVRNRKKKAELAIEAHPRIKNRAKGELEYDISNSSNRTHEEKTHSISDLTVAIGFARCEFIIKELALTHHCVYRELTARIAELLQHTAMR